MKTANWPPLYVFSGALGLVFVYIDYVIPVHVLFSGYVCRFSGEAAVIGKFIPMYIEYSFPIVQNVI